MATTTSNRRTQIPVREDSLVRPAPRSTVISEEQIAEKKTELRLETLARFDIEAEARQLRMDRKRAEQEARDREAKKVDAAAYAKKMDDIQAMIRGMSDSEFKKYQQRIDYMTPEMEEMIRERSGLPTISKAIRGTKSDDLMAELKKRGVLPSDFQPSSTTSDSPETADSSIDLNDPAENAAS